MRKARAPARRPDPNSDTEDSVIESPGIQTRGVYRPVTRGSQLWALKYRPETVDDFPLYKRDQRDTFVRLIDAGLRGEKHVIVVNGPVGCGKTATIEAVCKIRKVDYLPLLEDEDLVDVDNVTSCSLLHQLDGFLARFQRERRAVMVVDGDGLTPEELRAVSDILDRYASQKYYVAPVVLVLSDDHSMITRTGPRLAEYFHFPPASVTVMKRVLERVARAECVPVAVLKPVLDSGTGDIRAAINALQWAGTSRPPERLNRYQALGEVLYQKRTRSAEQILSLSQEQPRRLVHGVFENAHDFYQDLSEAAQLSEALSVADVMLHRGWNNEDVQEIAATTVTRTILGLTRTGTRTFGYRLASRTRLFPRKAEDRPWLCWPGVVTDPKQADELLFDNSRPRFVRTQREVLLPGKIDEQTRADRAAEEAALLEWDPIE